MPAYKSYCWSLGTTSFRMNEFNRKIEKQLELLEMFWVLDENKNELWTANNDLQVRYYDFLKDNEFIMGNAKRKDKDAREKTSGLVALGLIDPERHLTDVGKHLLAIAQRKEFTSNNIFRIASDSYIYFKQLLKYNSIVEGNIVRPFIVLAYMLSKLEKLTKEEFTYLLPLAVDTNTINLIITNIIKVRQGILTIDDVVLEILERTSSYVEAKNIFLSNKVTESIITEVGMNRKSRKYDKPYFELYNALKEYWKENSNDNAMKIYEALSLVKSSCRQYWTKTLFVSGRKTVIKRDGSSAVNRIDLFASSNEQEFKEEFFRLLHLCKAKSLLADYYDLNKRYFKTSELILFDNNEVKFDIIPKSYFGIIQDKLLEIAFIENTNLTDDVLLKNIDPLFDINDDKIFARIKKDYVLDSDTIEDIVGYIEKEKYVRFNKLINEKFSDEKLIYLLDCFEQRRDEEITNNVSDNADVPTIFEYILGIIWYKISGKNGQILDYMHLSLDADLLPVTHAAGGMADIVYKYDSTEYYPAHDLLLEATLANKTNQRRMEMEPVSRHLGDYLLANKGKQAYCVFATTYLNLNVVSDFRSRKHIEYYSNDSSECVNEMKIIPCDTCDLKSIINKGITYNELYTIFEVAYNSTLSAKEWHTKEIKERILQE